MDVSSYPQGSALRRGMAAWLFGVRNPLCVTFGIHLFPILRITESAFVQLIDELEAGYLF